MDVLQVRGIARKQCGCSRKWKAEWMVTRTHVCQTSEAEVSTLDVIVSIMVESRES